MFGSNKKNKRHFKSQSSYLWSIILDVIWIAGCTLTIFYFAGFSEAEMKEEFLNQELVGSSSQRGAQGIQMFLVKYFGKKGIIAVLAIPVVTLSFSLVRELEEFIRYRKRLRLFRNGYNVDFVNEKGKLNLLELLRMFKIKDASSKTKSTKKQQKEIKKSKLYKQLYED